MSPRLCVLVLSVVSLVTASAGERTSRAEAIIFAPQSGAASDDHEISRWQQHARTSDAKSTDFERLGWAFVAQARRTLDAGYYTLAEKTADAMDARFGRSEAAQLLRGHAWHNLHRFREAETIARQLVATRGAPDDFALLSDALMEQGRLDEAVAALQRLVNLKPGVEAYSRIAHLRWLKGDLRGAIAPLELAFASSAPQEAETRAWLETRLSALHLQAGAAPCALALADSALHRLANFPPALLARGRALLALGQTAPAIAALEHAARLNPLPEYQWWLADALRAAGHSAEAAAVETNLTQRGAFSDPRTLALFLATHRAAAPTAVALARAELANRADVFSHDALAWALFADGDLSGAETAIDRALAEHTQDARLFWHAGEIALANGHRSRAQTLFTRALPLAATLTPGERAALMQHTPATASSARARLLFPSSQNLTCTFLP